MRNRPPASGQAADGRLSARGLGKYGIVQLVAAGVGFGMVGLGLAVAGLAVFPMMLPVVAGLTLTTAWNVNHALTRPGRPDVTGSGRGLDD